MNQELENILSLCSVSTRMTAGTFFPERFNQPFAENVHGKIFDLIDGPANKVAIAAPRGWGKTSIVALALMARYIMFNLTNFIVYINKSETAAVMQTENLKRELITSPAIRQLFGPVKTRGVKDWEMEETFSKKAWVAYNTLILPRGAGQQVRGVIFKNDRPGLIIIDDLEDKKKVMNEDLRIDLKTWLHADVLEAIPQLHMNWKIIYIDTLKHEAALLQSLIESPDWATVRLEACDDNFKSTAPEFVSDETIARKWLMAQNAGETDVFFQEQRNLPISTKDSAFNASNFRYYNAPLEKVVRINDLKKTDAELQIDQSIENVVIVDPAKTVKMNSAESAIIGIGIDLVNARLYIRNAIADKLYPDELYSATFEMATQINAMALGFEETSLNEFIKQPLKNEMFRRNQFYNLVWLKPRGGGSKEGRVRELVPYYRHGYIYHNAACPTIKRLENQLLMFPRSAKWDLMDCLAYIIQMLELGERYFMPTYDKTDPEAEYAELNYEPAIENWRYA